MTTWAGTQWQLIDSNDDHTTIGILFGVGLLNETLEATGSLSMALSALRTELARPVELGPGNVSLPEATAELGTDTATITLRGNRDALASAWRRLPSLFRTAIVTEKTQPLRPESPIWPRDLAHRTGQNAAALSWLQVTAPDAREHAATVLTQLDPALGSIRAVFFTNDESLIGEGFPVREGDPGRSTSQHWADGTPKPSEQAAASLFVEDAAHPGAASGARPDPNGKGCMPGADPIVLASMLVPRTSAGLAATRLLRAQLGKAADAAGIGVPIQVHMLGVGPSFCVFMLANASFDDQIRVRVLTEFTETLMLVPDPWLEDTLENVGRNLSSQLARDRAALGLGPDPELTPMAVRQALSGALNTMHLAFSQTDLTEPKAPLRYSKRRPNKHKSNSLFNTTEPVPGFLFLTHPIDIDERHLFESWIRNPLPEPVITTNRLIMGSNGMLAGIRAMGHRQPTTWRVVDTERAIAVLEDQAGSLAVIDEHMRIISFHPALFQRRRKLIRTFDRQLAGVPRFSFTTEVNPDNVKRQATRGKLFVGGLMLMPIAFGVFIVAMIIHQQTADPFVTERITIGDTATLANDTTITAEEFTVQSPTPDEIEYIVTVPVTFCAGSNTKDGDIPPETQRTVAPEDFNLYGESGAQARLIDSEKQLREVTLQRGDCTAGELVFKGLNLHNPKISYQNEVGDDVVWYSYGSDQNG